MIELDSNRGLTLQGELCPFEGVPMLYVESDDGFRSASLLCAANEGVLHDGTGTEHPLTRAEQAIVDDWENRQDEFGDMIAPA